MKSYYLWDGWEEDEVLAHLRAGALCEKDGEHRFHHLRAAVTGLLDFAQHRALTTRPLREYILRRFLEQDNVYTRAFSKPHEDMHPLLYATASAEVRAMWEEYLSVKWSALLNEIALGSIDHTPSPSALARSGGCLPAYAASLEALLACPDHDALHLAMIEHLRRFGAGKDPGHRAYNWKGEALVGIDVPDLVHFDDLLEIDYQKEVLLRNTADFLAGRPANNVLLCGSMGSGKTSCIKALMRAFEEQNLRIVAVQRSELHSLDALLAHLARMSSRYLVFLDDLSFDEDDNAYSQLKIALDGDLSRPPENVLFYATSNRRNIVREGWQERAGDEVHVGDAQAEKQSLSERFGIKLFFGRYGQGEYFAMIAHGLARHGLDFDDEARARAIEWERSYHARSGRSAANFIRHYAGEKAKG